MLARVLVVSILLSQAAPAGAASPSATFVAQDIVAQLLQTESTVRAYVATKEPVYHDAAFSFHSRLAADVRTLDGMTKSRPQLHRLVLEARPEIAAAEETMLTQVARLDDGKRVAAIRHIADEEPLLRNVRKLVAAIAAQERT